jgi:hypothetical protein
VAINFLRKVVESMEGWKVNRSRVKNLPNTNWALNYTEGRVQEGVAASIGPSGAITKPVVDSMLKKRVLCDRVQRVGSGASSVTYRLRAKDAEMLMGALLDESAVHYMPSPQKKKMSAWVLLKVPLKRAGVRWRNYVEDMFREAGAQEQLSARDPSLVPSLYFAAIDPAHALGVLLMEYIDEGKTLAGSRITSSLYQKIDALYRRMWLLGFVHMDAKEDNVGVRSDGRLVVFDVASVAKLPDSIHAALKTRFRETPNDPAWKVWESVSRGALAENTKLVNAQLAKYVGKSTSWPDWKFLSRLYKKMNTTNGTNANAKRTSTTRVVEDPRPFSSRRGQTGEGGGEKRSSSSTGFTVRTMKPNTAARKAWVPRKHGKAWSGGLGGGGGGGGGGLGGGLGGGSGRQALSTRVSSRRQGISVPGLRVQLPRFRGSSTSSSSSKQPQNANQVGASSRRTPQSQTIEEKGNVNEYRRYFDVVGADGNAKNVKKALGDLLKNIEKVEGGTPVTAAAASSASSSAAAAANKNNNKLPNMLNQIDPTNAAYVYAARVTPMHLNANEWNADGNPVSAYEAFMRARPAFRTKPNGNGNGKKDIFRGAATMIDNINTFQGLADRYNTMIVVYAVDKNNADRLTRITDNYYIQRNGFLRGVLMAPLLPRRSGYHAFVPTQWIQKKKVPEKARPVYLLHTLAPLLGNQLPKNVKEGLPLSLYQPLLRISARTPR